MYQRRSKQCTCHHTYTAHWNLSEQVRHWRRVGNHHSRCWVTAWSRSYCILRRKQLLCFFPHTLYCSKRQLRDAAFLSSNTELLLGRIKLCIIQCRRCAWSLTTGWEMSGRLWGEWTSTSQSSFVKFVDNIEPLLWFHFYTCCGRHRKMWILRQKPVLTPTGQRPNNNFSLLLCQLHDLLTECGPLRLLVVHFVFH